MFVAIWHIKINHQIGLEMLTSFKAKYTLFSWMNTDT